MEKLTCKKIGCYNPPAPEQVYCSRECAPYAYMLPHRKKYQRKGTSYQAETWKRRKGIKQNTKYLSVNDIENNDSEVENLTIKDLKDLLSE